MELDNYIKSIQQIFDVKCYVKMVCENYIKVLCRVLVDPKFSLFDSLLLKIKSYSKILKIKKKIQ